MRNIVVKNTAQTPIYQQLYDQLSSKIMNGDFTPNEMLPSMRRAAKELRVSIITIKKTWEMLETQGLIYTIQAKGSYVSSHTQIDLEAKKKETIKHVLHDALKTLKSYNISKEMLLDIFEKMYDDMNK
jgi:GntR family transcriptional regulator